VSGIHIGSLQQRCRQFVMALVLSSAAVMANAADDAVHTVKLANGSDVVLNGVGEARELTGSLYLGALYLEHRSSNPDVIATSVWSKRISMRISADKLYGRRLGQLWRERIAINSDRKLVTELGKEVMQFVDALKDTFVKGDEIAIDFLPEKGTSISVNGTEIARIKKPQLYELLVQAWVGEKPPTAQFKVGVLGSADDATAIALQQQYAALKPSAKRVAETSTWGKRDELAAGG
jgi:colicin import membrane protein